MNYIKNYKQLFRKIIYYIYLLIIFKYLYNYEKNGFLKWKMELKKMEF